MTLPTTSATSETAANPPVRKPKGVPCGAAICDGAKRFCCWNHRTGSGHCTTSDNCLEDPDRGIYVSECASPRDCGDGSPCCFAPGAAALCANSPLMSRTPGTPIECGYGAFCEAVGDCPTHISQAPDEWKLVGCKAEEWAEFFPPGTKSCIYR